MNSPVKHTCRYFVHSQHAETGVTSNITLAIVIASYALLFLHPRWRSAIASLAAGTFAFSSERQLFVSTSLSIDVAFSH